MAGLQTKIELLESKQKIWRRLILPDHLSFRRFHRAIQIAMGWQDYHLYEFIFKQENLRITNDEEVYNDAKQAIAMYKGKTITEEMDPFGFIKRSLENEVKLSHEVKINSYLQKYKTLEYVYDFGDYWQHQITVEKVIDEYDQIYPEVIEWEGDCPPEDVGGPGGYQEFLSVIKNPKDSDYKETKVWAKSQGYKPYDVEQVNKTLKTRFSIRELI